MRIRPSNRPICRKRPLQQPKWQRLKNQIHLNWSFLLRSNLKKKKHQRLDVTETVVRQNGTIRSRAERFSSRIFSSGPTNPCVTWSWSEVAPTSKAKSKIPL